MNGNHLIPCLARAAIAGVFLYAGWWAYDATHGIWEMLSVSPMYRTIAIAMTGLLCWRYRHLRPRFTIRHGSAAWRIRREMERDGQLGGAGGLVLGRWQDYGFSRIEALRRLFGEPLRDSDNVVRYFLDAVLPVRLGFYRNDNGPVIRIKQFVAAFVAAPPGAGKGIGVVIPTLLGWAKSCVILDIKGELYVATVEARKALGQAVFCLNPFLSMRPDTGEAIPAPATINPMDLLPRDSPLLVEYARNLAESLVVRTGKEHEKHFDNKAQDLIAAVITAVALIEEGEYRTLRTVRHILGSAKGMAACLEFLAHTPLLGGCLNPTGEGFQTLSKSGDREWASVLSCAHGHTAWMDSPLMQDALSATSFDVMGIAKNPTSLYIIIPPEFLESHSRLVRVYVNAVLMVVKLGGASERNELLLMLDEVPALGRLEPLRNALSQLRGYGLRQVWIAQSISQMEVSYPEAEYKSLLDMFPLKVFFGVCGLDTAKYVSECIGKRTEQNVTTQKTNSTNHGGGQQAAASYGNSQGVTVGEFARDHISPDEILRLGAKTGVIILQQGEKPCLARRIAYYEDPEFNPELPAPEQEGISPASYALACGLLASLLYAAEQHVSFAALWPRREAKQLVSGEPLLDFSELTRRGGQAPVRKAVAVPQEIELECPCGQVGMVPASAFGQTVQCPKCLKHLLVLDPDSSEESAP